MTKNSNIQIVAYIAPDSKRACNRCGSINTRSGAEEGCQQLELFPLLKKRQKPQISSVPGVSPKDPKRYRVKLGNKVLGDRLTLDEARKLANHR